jgi:hypothetical protein
MSTQGLAKGIKAIEEIQSRFQEERGESVH